MADAEPVAADGPVTAHSPIAVIGIACRLPGAENPDEFWQLLEKGMSAVTSIPADRWPRPSGAESAAIPGKGAFLRQVDEFDAAFFGISPREAAAMDPQQRLVLELGWEALEDAGLTTARLARRRTGVFVGAINDDYAALLHRHGHEAVTHHTLTGLTRGMIANRLSYLLGAHGPSMVVDSGQSSSLVAVHAACQSLRAGECETAFAGGVNLNLTFDGTLGITRFGGLSPDGRCFTFDARANGYVRGEGGGLVLLKPLDRALADGDRIHGVLRGSAVNNDGGGDTLTTPSRTAQEEVLRRARAAAGTRPDEIQYVELHGTGTAVGDPIEAAALAGAITSEQSGDHPLRVGSAKTNVGHLEGAAGITGLIKVLLALKARRLPPSLNFRTPNPAIPLDRWKLQVQTATTDWPRPGEPLVAGVSAFGVGGTNAHVIVAEAPTNDAPSPASAPSPADGREPVLRTDGLLPWPVSGRSADGLRGQAARLRGFASDGDHAPADLAWSLAAHRTALEHRAVVLAGTPQETLTGLDAIAAGGPAAHVVGGIADAGAGPVFVFPGQGSQWVGMAAELLDSSPVFAASVERCARALEPYLDWNVLDVLRETADDTVLARVEVIQPALWTVMVSLAELWRSLGVEPAAVVGHSQGEIAAACVAGVLGLEDGARLVALRSQVAAEGLAGRGGMATVAASAERVGELLADRDDVWIAAVNGPAATVVAGRHGGLAEVTARAEAEGLRARTVVAAWPSHSPLVTHVRDALLEVASTVTPRPGTVPVYSTVTAGPVAGESLDAEYWYRNVREPVRFQDTVRALADAGHTVFLEVSPHPVLTNAVLETGHATGTPLAGTGTLRRGEGGARRLLTSLAQLWTYGAEPDWSRVFAGTGARRTDLPGYAFQRRRYWLDASTPVVPAVVASAAPAAVPTVDEPALNEPLAAGPDVAYQVRAHSAAVLGHATPDDLDARRTFKDLGFDSIMLGDLCGRLNGALGSRLSTTELFDHPTPAGLAEHLAAMGSPVRRPGPGEAATAAVASVESVKYVESVASAGSVDPVKSMDPVKSTDPVESVAGDEDPIAIVAMSCRLPGGVRSPEDLWRLVAAEQDAISAFPEDRDWDLEQLAAGGTTATGGGFLDGIADFDARFFGLSPREVLAMDPQQRLLLETSWELLERAGIDPESLRGSRTGVFVGTMDQEYGPRLHEAPEELAGHLLTGKTASVASGRIAYHLGLTGPAITLDTACSSSLVALHLAIQSLRRRETSLAFVGGVTVLNTPGIFTEFSRQGGLSPDGRCKAFAAAADGTGMAEGAGMLLVERLSDARRNGHRVLAVIRGSAVNQDGASNGLTAPSGRAQQQVVRDALASAGLPATEVDVVEAHGTGTALGDPIEARALLATYGRNRPAGRPVLLGSVKSNIGHTQAAAGIAGVIKMVMAMREGVVPATLHIDRPTPEVDWSSGTVELVTGTRPWPDTGHARRAAVSSFGISGTNAHVIVEQAPAGGPAPEEAVRETAALDTGEVLPWVVSGRTRAGLRGQAEQLREFAAATGHRDADVARSLIDGRSAMEHRAVVVAGDREGFLSGLAAIAAGEPAEHVVDGTAAEAPGKGPVFVFPGQGSQWAGMATELLDASTVFADSIDRCAQALAPYVGWDLHEALRDEELLRRVDVVQPALWAVMASLAALWRSLGIEPSAVIGHSQGEIAAACVAGALELTDGARLIALRSQIIARELAGHGGMLSLAASEERTGELLAGHDCVWIATVNGPASTVVAGDPDALAAVTAEAEAAGLRPRTIAVDYASHTPHVERIHNELLTLAAEIEPRDGDIPLHSTVTGEPVPGSGLDAAYWYRNLREQVRFDETVRALVAAGHTSFLEVSPHPVLTTPLQETAHATQSRLRATPTLRRGHGGPAQLLASLGALWAQGHTPDWNRVLTPGASVPVDLPTYAFQRDRYWLSTTGPEATTKVELPSASEALDGFPRRVADAATPARQRRVALDEVRRHAAAVLGWPSADDVEAGEVFREIGFDSLTAVELRNRLVAATGAALSPTAVFDHPTPAALARHLLGLVTGTDTTVASVSGAPAPSDEPIAIVAVNCRFPGDVRSPEDLWQLLTSGRDTLSGFPEDRGWDLGALLHPDSSRPGSSSVHRGGFLHDAADFDAGFFGIAPREAVAMDPQQRLLLETSWELLERAGIDPTSLRGSRTGVFVGVVQQGYGTGADTKGSEGYLFTGSTGSVASGRIAYSLGLTGPALTVDTACSSSLVALHLAVQSLRNGECGMALVGGSSVMSTPGIFTEFSHQHALAPDGRCKPFAAAADGTAWAEGVGVLLVERLSDARRNGHQVLAVIRGSAVNQDGASNGLTAPNGPSQQRVIREALANAGVVASEVDVVEAHGTGTALGDPIEAQALLATYGQDRPEDRPLLLGSMKSNIGHTQAAAGVSAVIKTVLALRAGMIPATLHVDRPTPHVDWNSGAVELVTDTVEWPVNDHVRRAAVSAFGVSGTNAHVILEAAPPVAEPETVTPAGGAVPWAISARSEAALREQAAQLREFAADDTHTPADVAWALATQRAALEHRAVVVAEDRDTLLAGLDAIATGEPAPHVVNGTVTDAPDEGPVFVFPGQGSQWPGMATELLDTSKAFADSIDRCAEGLAPYVDWDLHEALRDEELLRRVDVVQPALWAVMVSLAALWRSLGIEPSAVIGHSQGEIAAACVAGALTLDDGARLVALRSQTIARELAGHGGMLSLAASEEHVNKLLMGRENVWIATLNGPASTVVAGDPDVLAAVTAEAETAGLRPRTIAVDYASHTPHVERIHNELLTLAAEITPKAADVPIYSTVTGRPISGDALDADYWYRNLREQVRFHPTIEALTDDGHTTFLEISPHPVLTHTNTTTIPTLRRDHGGPTQLLTSLATLWTHGHTPNWHHTLTTGTPLNLPTYPFQRSRYWLDAPAPLPTTPPDAHADFWELVEHGDLEELARTLRLDADARDGLASVVPALSAWHHLRTTASALDAWRYREDWKPLPESPAARLTGTWLVVVAPGQADGEMYEAVTTGLREHGAAVETVVAPERAEQWPGVLAAHPDTAGVLSLLALDETPVPDAPATPAGLHRTLLLVQGLAAAAVPLWCVTRGAVSVGDHDPLTAPAQALVWGLGRVAAQELPDAWGGLIDLPASAPDGRMTAGLCSVLASGSHEDQVAVRESGVLGRRLARAARRDGAPAGDWTPGAGTVLITGGTGALGGQVARRLAERGAEHLLLVSRRGADAPGAAELAAELTAAGAGVTLAACDVGDAEALRDLIGAIPAGRPLTAVFHTAAVLDDAALESLTPDQVDRVLRAKAASAWHLHELTRDLDLSAFVLFSSLAGTVGMTGQGNYAPANAYADALARYRRSQGLVATSIAWGAWAQGGMADRDAVADKRVRHGVPPLLPESAVLALEAALEQDDTALVIADIDWDRFAHVYTATRPSPLLDGIPEARQVLGDSTDRVAEAPGGATLRDRLADADPRERARRLLEAVRAQVAAVLGHDSAEAVETKRQFLDLGLDSVTAVELRNRLGAVTGLRLPASVVFDHPTVTDLVRHITAELFDDTAADTDTSGAAELDRLEELLTALPDDSPARGDIATRLRRLLRTATADDAPAAEELEAVTDDELFGFIEKEFGIS
uniref:type I polyketide synthase n=1 Tax=Streptomyces luteireticuli TaxID=173858 RepID=UPI003FD75A41